MVYAWAVEGDSDPAQLQSNMFTFKGREFPEVDRAGWFSVAEARNKLLRGQLGFLDQLGELL